MSVMLRDRYRDRMAGVLFCYDQIVITGTLPGICYAAGMTSFLKGIRIFDYPRDLARLSEPQHDGERTIKGLNFFERTEQGLLRALQRPEFNIHGMRRPDIKPAPLNAWALSRQLHCLRALGLIKRVARSYRCYLTRLGRAAIAAACSVTQFQIIPAMAYTK